MYASAAPQAFDDYTARLEVEPHAPLAVVVRVSNGHATPSTLSLEQGSCIIGSSPGCDLTLADPAVSRRHLELSLAPEGVTVRDLGSRNGTFFHGQRIEKMVLRLGGQLTVGSTCLSIEADPQALARDLEHQADMPSYRGIVGASSAMRHVFAWLRRLEGSLATVLVEGESGVGKERVAQALHQGSQVAEGPLVTLNCGAFPRELIASELFGHRRGAFSGAIDDRQGAFQCADGGTLFLDEIGELPLELQPMLLRAIELGEVRRIGDEQARHVSVRVVAATHRNLEAEVAAGRFRQDLFYRLAVVRLLVPPLRERPDDIAPLARHFAAKQGMALDDTTLAELRCRAWPGNARELKNALVSLGALGMLPAARASVGRSMAELVAPLVDIDRPLMALKEEVAEVLSQLYLEQLLEATGGNRSEAARRSGLNRTYLQRLLKKLDAPKAS